MDSIQSMLDDAMSIPTDNDAFRPPAGRFRVANDQLDQQTTSIGDI
jgi:hypothetical protein